MSPKWSIYVGYDPREIAPYAVTRDTAKRASGPIPVHGLILDDLRTAGLYHRPTSIKDGKLWDDISDAAMSTEFAISRFLVPHLAKSGWALFMDADQLVRGNLFALFNDVSKMGDKAVVCVKHDHRPDETVKMDGQVQYTYARKNWSSFMFFNVDHPANASLTVDLVNTVPGRDLHRFCWLDDEKLIGEIGREWNYLVGYTKGVKHPQNVHFTLGTPDMAGHEDDEFADEWRAELLRWAR